MSHNLDKLHEIFDRYPKTQESLISVLQDIQKEYQYLPPETLTETSKVLDIPLSKVFSVSTFYNSFSLNERGETVIKVCTGTACHIRGAKLIKDQIESLLNLKSGETSKDKKFTLEEVACVGACAMAPVVITNDKYHGSVKVSNVKKLLKAK
ncbi:MAG: NAD(P)H-dependent oxidoreductase subunit E [candidate division Zixibacteria bacterium]|nr:NAD(P)H-dependent oxidoreductase subunit E [candidate division Zixibacteria bacterium]